MFVPPCGNNYRQNSISCFANVNKKYLKKYINLDWNKWVDKQINENKSSYTPTEPLNNTHTKNEVKKYSYYLVSTNILFKNTGATGKCNFCQLAMLKILKIYKL